MNTALTAAAAGLAFAASFTLTPLARKLACRVGAVSKPDGKRKLQARPTPLGGGGAVYLASFLSIAACCALATDAWVDKLPAALGLSAGLLCLLGAYDDLYDLPARWKLLGQILSSLPVVLAGSCVSQLSLFGYNVPLGWLGVPLTVGWLVLGVNALNLLDGIDGLASLTGIVVSLAVGVIAAGQSRPEVMLLAMVMAGALAGFLLHNLPPARIYLGDCGSMVIGFTLALLALRVSLVEPQSPTTSRLTIALALMFVPLTDTTLAIIRRRLKGLSVMAADRGHIHHQLLDRGWNNWKVLGLLGSFGLVTGLVAWWVSTSGTDLLGWIALGSIAALLASRQLLAHQEWTLAKPRLYQLTAGLQARLSLAGRRQRSASEQPSWPDAEPDVQPGPVILSIQRPSAESQSQEARKAA